MQSFNSIYIIEIADVDDCVPNECMNDGICEDAINTFKCNCAHGFTGALCDISKYDNVYSHNSV